MMNWDSKASLGNNTSRVWLPSAANNLMGYSSLPTAAKKVLVAIFADTCGACQRYLERWGKIKDNLIKDRKDLEIVEIHVPNMNTISLEAKDPRLVKIIDHYPTLLVMSDSTWKNSSTPLVGNVKEVNQREEDIRNGLDAFNVPASTVTNYIVLPSKKEY